MNKRFLELFGILLVGDGLLTLLDTRRHCVLWDTGPKVWRETIDVFTDHPNASRVAGMLEAALGWWLATKQHPSPAQRARHPFSF